MNKTNNNFLKDLLNKNQFVKVKLYKIKTQHLICFGSINDIKGIFLIDTGASNSCLSLENKDLYNLKTQGKKFEASGASDKKMEAILLDLRLELICKLLNTASITDILHEETLFANIDFGSFIPK